MITLYGCAQSRSFRVLWALEEAKLTYDYKPVKIGSPDENGTQTNSYKLLNAQGKVPSIVDGDIVVNESLAILNYIASITSQSDLIPQNDAQLRAFYDELCSFVISDLEQPLWTYAKHTFALPKQYRIKGMRNIVEYEFARSLKALEHYLGNNLFAVGGNFTMADILICHTLRWAKAVRFEISPDLERYLASMVQRQAYQLALNQEMKIG